MARTRGVCLAWLSAVVSLCAGCADRTAERLAPTPGASDEGPAEVAPDVNPDTRYVAVLVPLEAVDVTCKEAGDLKAVHVRLGDVVAAGDAIAELDLGPIAEDLRIARARLDSFKDLLGQRKIEIAAAERELEIQTEMLSKGIGARKQVEAADFALARARKIADQAVADVTEQQAHIAKLQRRVREATIEAPFSGAVARRYRDPGTAVSAGTAIVRLIRVDALWVRFAVPPTDIAHIEQGETIRVEVDTPEVSLPATVEHVSPELDPDAQMVFVEARLEVPELLQGHLRAGLPAWVRPLPPR